MAAAVAGGSLVSLSLVVVGLAYYSYVRVKTCVKLLFMYLLCEVVVAHLDLKNVVLE